MNWRERIVLDPAVMVGKPLIRGTRVSVELIIDLLAQGWSREQILQQYDHLKLDDIQACLSYVSEMLRAARQNTEMPAVLTRCSKSSACSSKYFHCE